VRVYIGGLTNNLKRIYIKFVTRRTLEESSLTTHSLINMAGGNKINTHTNI
jgi:hypothetical protein